MSLTILPLQIVCSTVHPTQQLCTMIQNMLKQTKKFEKLAAAKEEKIANRKIMKKSKIRRKRLIVRIQEKNKEK
jgi:hypothetical protein